MEKLNIRSLKARAQKTLENTKPDYRKLVFLHGAVSVGVMLVLSLMQLLVSLLDTNTGGLDAMANGAMINTTLSSISSISSLVLPFWQVGILFTSLLVVRGQFVNFSMLTQGFRRVGPLLRFGILIIAILFGVCMGSAYILSMYMMIVPVPDSVIDALKPLTEQELADPNVLLKAMPSEFWQYMIVPTLLYLVLVLGVMLYLLYRFRMSQYIILDGENMGARMSMGISNQMTKGYKWDLVKLDLSFWWFYLLQVLATMVAEIPMILSLCGITLPMNETVASLICYLVYSGVHLLILYYFGAYVETTYACTYEVLAARHQALSPIYAPSIEPLQDFDAPQETPNEVLAIPEEPSRMPPEDPQ